MTKALLDQGLPRSATAFLQRAGWEAVHVYDLGLSQAPDRDIPHMREPKVTYVLRWMRTFIP